MARRTWTARTLLGFVGLILLASPAPARAADEVGEAIEFADPAKALETIHRLAESPDAAARKSLVRISLESRSARLRAAAGGALANRADTDAAVESLVYRWMNAGAQKSIPVRAAEALGRIPTPRAERALLARWNQDDAATSTAVAHAISTIGKSRAAVDRFEELLLADAFVVLRAAAADALGRVGGDDVLLILATAAGRESSRLVRERIVDAMLASGADAARTALVGKYRRASAEERTGLRFAAARIPIPELIDEFRAALKLTRPVDVVGACLALGALESPPTLAELDELAERASSHEPLVRDAGIAALLRRTSRDAEVRIRLLERPLPSAAKVAILATLEQVQNERALAALVEAAKSRDFVQAATAVGALRRGHGAAGARALEMLKGSSPFVESLLASITSSGQSSQPRAFVALGNADRMEEAMGPLGWLVTPLPSTSDLRNASPSPEDVVAVDGPGESDRQVESQLRRFVLLGGTLVLGDGFSNNLCRALVPDAIESAPANLALETATPATIQHVKTPGQSLIQDFVVTASSGSDAALAKTLDPAPAVMLVPRPVTWKSAAARPLLWSAEMEDRYHGGAGCVAAEVRLGCGRILILGATVGLKGALQDEGWFGRVRLERSETFSRATTVLERKMVAYDSFGIDEGRLAALATAGAFDGKAPYEAVADHPAARWLRAYLSRR